MSYVEKISIVVFILVIVIGVVLYGAGKNVVPNKPVKIGASLMLSGPYAEYGKQEQRGIELALDKIGRDKIEIIYEDNQADTAKAITDVQKLINIDRVKIIIGPDCGSGCTLAAAPITEPLKVIQVAPSASNPDVADVGEYLFTFVSLDNYEAKLMAEFVSDKLKAKRAAVIYVNDAWGAGLKNMFEELFAVSGGEVVFSEGFKRTEKDFRTILIKVKEKHPDFIYAVGYEELIDMLEQMRALKMDERVLSASMIENIQDKKRLMEAGEGVIYTSQLIDIDEEFKQKYKAKYELSPDLFSSIQYDIVNFLYEATQACQENTDCIKKFLYTVKNRKGASGIITLNSEGWVERPMQLKIIKNKEFAIYEEEK